LRIGMLRCLRAGVVALNRSCEQAYMRVCAGVFAFRRAWVQAWIRAGVLSCSLPCVQTCLRASVRACLRVSVVTYYMLRSRRA
jgi:hypothetical protein